MLSKNPFTCPKTIHFGKPYKIILRTLRSREKKRISLRWTKLVKRDDF